MSDELDNNKSYEGPSLQQTEMPMTSKHHARILRGRSVPTCCQDYDFSPAH